METPDEFKLKYAQIVIWKSEKIKRHKGKIAEKIYSYTEYIIVFRYMYKNFLKFYITDEDKFNAFIRDVREKFPNSLVFSDMILMEHEDVKGILDLMSKHFYRSKVLQRNKNRAYTRYLNYRAEILSARKKLNSSSM